MILGWKSGTAGRPSRPTKGGNVNRRGVATAVAVAGTLVLLGVQAGAITPAGGSGRASTGTVPGPPRAVTATGVDGAINVSWIAPGSSGSSPITGYLIRARSGSVIRSCRTTAMSCTISQLTNGVSYAVTARARNAAGWSHPSVAVNAEPTQQNCAVVGPYANLQGCNLTNKNLTSANLSHANLSNANLSGAVLTYADLSYANLSSAALETTNLVGADLVGADLAGAFLGFANLSGAALYGADLMGVTWINTTCPDGSNSDSDGGTCIGHGI
jgi:hypothetical protein